MNVASVLSETLNVAKVDQDVGYTCMLQAYVLSVFRCFICVFASVSSRCCIYLQWFSNVFQAFSQVFQTLVSSILSFFFYMLQLLHVNVSNVDQVLHMGRVWEAASDVDDVRGGMDDVRGGTRQLLVRSFASSTRWALIRSLCKQRPDASA
jgi:hypothetical protein